MFFKPAPDSLPPLPGVKKYFIIQRLCFAILGIDPTSLEKTVFNRFLAWIPAIWLFLVNFPIVVYASQYIKDLILVTDALAPFWQLLLSAIKFSVFMWNRKKIVKLIRRIWLKNLEASTEELKIIDEENRKDTIYAKFYFSMVLSTNISASISPLIIAFIQYLKGNDFWQHLDPPLKADYFINTKTYLGYGFVFTWDVICFYCVLGIAVGSDTLFAWFAHNISAQFRIVKLRFYLTADGVRGETEMMKSIISCIRYHRYVIDLADTLNDVYMVTAFIKFTISFLQIACIVFQLSRGSEISQMLFHVLFVVAVSTQLMLYCHSAQQVIDESESVAGAIYDGFKWHDLSTKSKKLLLLPMMRSQKPCRITGLFFVIDLPLFLGVFKTAGSFITMLISLDQGK